MGKTLTGSYMLENGNSNVFNIFKFHNVAPNLPRAAGSEDRGIFRTLLNI